MKKIIFILSVFLLLATANTTFSSCTPKIGCELNEGMSPKTNKKGELSKKKGKSSLFDKKKRKKMGY